MFWLKIPASVPAGKKNEYYRNWRLATKRTGNLMLFAGDQKIEHLNDDFFGKGIDPDDANPEHLFKIASAASIGVFASQLGLISQYGRDYKKIPYLVKLNSKTGLIKTEQQDPKSGLLNTVDEVLELKKKSRLKIVGVGFTLYPGSEFESQALSEASNIIYQAHRAGLLAVLWIYPRGKAVKNEKDSHLAAGMAGLAASLGADFVKLSHPKSMTKAKYAEIINAAGRTGVIFSGGESVEPKEFLACLKKQIDAGARGNATGRNIHQKGLKQAINFCNAIAAISVYGTSVDKAWKIYLGKERLK